IVLDPVGAGATTFRTESALRLLRELPITVLRGNRGEIGALVGSGEVRGVEATGSEDPLKVAKAARDVFGVTVAVTGPTDVIVGPDRTYLVRNGSPLLAIRGRSGRGCWMRWRRWVRKERAGSTSASRKRRTASWSMVSPQAFCGASPVANLRARRWRCDQARFGGETPLD
ncbi:MAG: hydroxyethylthiazole kinase, partial [Thermomicrobiales bacterium]|nr:hydroxyethylthiazole kinase [Thermomicrobiales bacterium]